MELKEANARTVIKMAREKTIPPWTQLSFKKNIKESWKSKMLRRSNIWEIN